MGRVIGTGQDDFEDLMRNELFYIDKTDFIREWWESGDKVTLITRPRRFGKTLNISMLNCFFSNQYVGRGDLFQGLSIWEHEKYRELQGTFPVISLSFAKLKEQTYESAVKRICRIITGLYDDNVFLLEEGNLTETEKRDFRDVCPQMDETLAVEALNNLSKYLSRYYGKKVIILLDEYDTPMQEAYLAGYWEEFTSFIRNLFNATFKSNPYMERAMMTGITRVSKESIFSDLNNLKVITTTSNQYETAFGFTETEVFAAMDEMGMAEKETVKQWYDGFTFGDQTDMYNPWSICQLLQEKKFAPYWANTSSNGLVGELLRTGDGQIKTQFEALLQGETLQVQLDEQIVFNQLHKKKNAIWSLFLASGYLKTVYVSPQSPDSVEKPMYELALTNFEVKAMFADMITDWFAEDSVNYNDFITALLEDDVDTMNDTMNELSLSLMSSFDVGNVPSVTHPERFYHGFVMGLMVDLRKKFVITSNRESGRGRYDIAMEPLGEDNAIIMEFKVFNPRKEDTLEDTVATALAQIEEKQYAQDFLTRGIPKERIRKYGFAFRGKEVLIGSGE